MDPGNASNSSSSSQGNSQGDDPNGEGFEYYLQQAANVARTVAQFAGIAATALTFLAAISGALKQGSQRK